VVSIFGLIQRRQQWPFGSNTPCYQKLNKISLDNWRTGPLTTPKQAYGLRGGTHSPFVTSDLSMTYINPDAMRN
jgi:hypothetical protein